ncbi:MAG: DUF2085 domain-containing protein [Chloroflexota bacterium]
MSGDPYNRDDEVSASRRAFDRGFLRALARAQIAAAEHWLFFLNLTSTLFVGMAVLSPLLRAWGWDETGRLIFQAYALACHQMPGRSFFLLGYQMAFCERNLAIFAAISLTGIAYALRRGEWRPLSWKAYAVLIAPMAVDGTTQLFAWRESTWELRVITGTLFGVASVWFLYPIIARAMAELSAESVVLLARDGNGEHSQSGGV